MQAIDIVRIKAAAARYEQRVGRAGGATAREAIVGAPPDRRKSRLAAQSTAERARAAVMEAEAHGAPRTSAGTLATIARERIIGDRDLLDINYLELAIAMGRAVCRLRVGTAAGTGVLVGPRTLMTNHHVIEAVGDARSAEAQFDYQESRSGSLLPMQAFRLDPTSFFLTDPALDYTLVAVSPTSADGRPIEDYPWVKLIGQLGKLEAGEPVNIIQHPRGGLKQIALRNNQVIEIPESQRDFLYYTTDTEPGSSGSPCFNDQWELVALHHSGVPRMRNGEVLQRDGSVWREGVHDPALIDWIANEGARVSAIVGSLEARPLPPPQAEWRGRMLNQTPPNPVEIARARPQAAGPGAPVVPNTYGRTLSLTIPVTITIGVGDAIVSAEAAGVTSGVAAQLSDGTAANGGGVQPGAGGSVGSAIAQEALDTNWATRRGYDPRFLGPLVSLPILSTAMEEDTVVVPEEFRQNGSRFLLHYHHYSVAMHRKRRFAWFSAANIDGDRRPKLPDRTDKWFIDPRIDDPAAPRFQCGEELYKERNTDRGHLTRYADVTWGDSSDEALRAALDTFLFTNACLQLDVFNQGRDRWQGLEQFLLEQKARKERRRMAVVTGPIFGEHDPVYQNRFMDYRIRIPVQFWKVCVLMREDETLAATAFILGQQDVAELPGFEEAFDVGAAQITLEDLEQRTGLNFGPLTEHDHFAQGGGPGTLEVDAPGRRGPRRIKPLRTFEDIVV